MDSTEEVRTKLVAEAKEIVKEYQEEGEIDLEIAERACELIDGHKGSVHPKVEPSSLAAGATYAAALLENKRLYRVEIAELFGVTGQTVATHRDDVLERILDDC